jgi:uncharacterized protein
VNLSTSFAVPLPVEDSWALLQDMEQVARWFPGAKLEGSEGDAFKGTVRVKLGPMVVDYRGTARFLERDEAAHRVVLEASGREQRGTGIAKAVAATQLEPDGAGTAVSVSVDLDISGRPAQLGHGLMQEVAQRLVAEFSDRMKMDLLGAGGTGRAPENTPPPSGSADGGTGNGSRLAGDDDAGVLDLGAVVGAPLLRRAALCVAVLVGLVVFVTWRSRSRALGKGRGG